jgi:general secretion pathway protein D
MSSVNPESQLKNAVDLIVDKKSVSTTVLVGSGDLLFLGGLRYQEAGKSVDQVPLLGDIPLLGQLFTYKSEVTYARNLVVSLRVSVISAPEQGKVTFLTQTRPKG